MPLVDAKCKNCGATVKVEDDRKEAFCPYCGAKYLVEQAIEYYNVTNVNNTYVSAKGEAEKERLLKNAKTYAELFELGKAEKIYDSIIEDYPDDYRGWYGKAQLLSRQFTKTDCEPGEFEKVGMYVSRALKFADNESMESIKKEWDKFLSEHNAFLNAKKREVEALFSQRYAKEDKLNREKERLAGEMKTLEVLGKKRDAINGGHKGWWIVLLVVGIGLLFGALIGRSLNEGRVLFAFLGVVFTIVGISMPVANVIRYKREKAYDEQNQLCNKIANGIAGHEEEINDIDKRIRMIRGVYKF